MAETLHYLLHHALTNIERCRKQAERTQPPRIAAHLGALIAQTEAIIADLEAGPAYATKVHVRHSGEVPSPKRIELVKHGRVTEVSP